MEMRYSLAQWGVQFNGTRSDPVNQLLIWISNGDGEPGRSYTLHPAQTALFSLNVLFSKFRPLDVFMALFLAFFFS